MNTQDFSLSQFDIDALVEHAREERAAAMREMLSALPGTFRRLAAKLRPNLDRLPQSGVWA